MGFITSLLLDAVVMSSVFAGVRRVTGISVQQLLEPRIRGEMAKLASRLFFGSGEWIVEKGALLAQRAKLPPPPKPPQ